MSIEDQERWLREGKCIYCGRYHVWCVCSWWTRHKMDVFMIAFTVGLLAFMGYQCQRM